MAKKMTSVMFASVLFLQTVIILLLLSISLCINTNSNEPQASITPPPNLPENLEVVYDNKEPKGLQVVDIK